MKTLAYLECPTGISGDMCLGALVHAGVPLGYLTSQLARLNMQDEFELRAERVIRNQQAATHLCVDLRVDSQSHHPPLPHQDSPPHEHALHERSHEHPPHQHPPHQHPDQGHPSRHPEHRHGPEGGRRLPDIEALIVQADLPERAAAWSLAVFRRLAEAEAAVHGIAPEAVHFHEVGATDAIVDIVGTCLGLDWLKVDGLTCSPLPTGGGTVRCDHGLLPVPVPAVLNMMASAKIPVYSNGIERELVTPTGCAIAATLAHSFGPPPSFTPHTIGLGAGSRELALPNILRLWIGTSADTDGLKGAQSLPTGAILSKMPTTLSVSKEVPDDVPAKVPDDVPDNVPDDVLDNVPDDMPETETIVELQTQLDDISPQAIAYVFEQLFAQGAVDVFTQPVLMKKSRLGTLLTVLCPQSAVTQCERLLFRETTTLGIRQTRQVRSVLARKMLKVTTAYGDIAIKVARAKSGGKVLNVQPEYEDCARVARSHNVPLQQVHQAAMDAAMKFRAET